MKLLVEIGNDEQRQLIRDELEPLLTLMEKSVPELARAAVVIPENFEETVNQLEGTSSYRSVRPVGNEQVTAIAKALHDADPPTIVVSANAYAEEYDTSVRAFVLVHEAFHMVRSKELRAAPVENNAEAIYRHSLGVFVDEYYADRGAYGIVEGAFKTRSLRWQQYLAREREGFLRVLLDPGNREGLRRAIARFRVYLTDVPGFWEEIKSIVDGVFISLAHVSALYDHYPFESKWEELDESPFVTATFRELVQFAREGYEARSYDLSGGINIVSRYMECFGIRIVDTDDGLYCHVLDI